MSEQEELRTVAESFLIAGAHPNLKLVAEAALKSISLSTQVEELRTALNRYGHHFANCTYIEGKCRCGFRDAILPKAEV